MAEQSLEAADRLAGTQVVTVTVRYFAAARAAAGVAQEQLLVPVPAAGAGSSEPTAIVGDASSAACTVGLVLAKASDRHGPGLARVLLRCSYLLDEVAVHGAETTVRDGQVLDILPPFAGG